MVEVIDTLLKEFNTDEEAFSMISTLREDKSTTESVAFTTFNGGRYRIDFKITDGSKELTCKFVAYASDISLVMFTGNFEDDTYENRKKFFLKSWRYMQMTKR